MLLLITLLAPRVLENDCVFIPIPIRRYSGIEMFISIITSWRRGGVWNFKRAHLIFVWHTQINAEVLCCDHFRNKQKMHLDYANAYDLLIQLRTQIEHEMWIVRAN